MDENGASVVLPFFLRGVTLHLTVILMTRDKFEHHGCTQIELTSRELTWYPSTDIYEDQENAMMDFKGDIIRPGIIDRGHLWCSNSSRVSGISVRCDVTPLKKKGRVALAPFLSIATLSWDY